MRYSIELKMKVLSEYERGKIGYKQLARKYGLKRDTVREWVLTKMVQSMTKDEEEKLEKDLAYYKTEAEFWKTYAEKLEEKRFGVSQKKNKNNGNKGVSPEEEVKDKPPL